MTRTLAKITGKDGEYKIIYNDQKDNRFLVYRLTYEADDKHGWPVLHKRLVEKYSDYASCLYYLYIKHVNC